MHRRVVLVCALLLTVFAGSAFPGAGPARADSDLVKARAAIFGADNVDAQTGAVRADRVIFSWFGVSNFAVAMAGKVFLVDAWVPNVYRNYVPTTPAQLAAIKPSHIFIGHAHFDHAADAVEIAARSGARLVGSAEHCAFFRQESSSVRCDAVAGSRPGTTATYDGLEGIGVTTVTHLHSELKAPTGDLPPLLPIPPSDRLITDPPQPDDLGRLAGHLGDPEGGAVLYAFDVGDRRIVWNDSVGPVAQDPAGPAVLAALRRLGPVDLHVGSIQGFNEITNGLKDAVRYIDAIRPKMFVPNHHDDWFPVIATPATTREKSFFDALASIDHRPEVRYLRDPSDYLNPDRITLDLAG
ncbi:MBL fold metallo-hydrolase [Gordonia jinghuaiqii]|uniref:MBL fold metallo-hydrolase n=1 Tax=Gordonia jinghuaiqii TaxID=2758710 RepID=A0A7D7R1Q8_9ACTN|nr:MBL fold metallo-hydrolase [Gordonia jinghuaiqii]MCR5979258.1 MBL fold metallo-hydrolase [Gordonia jinghuaiqii]QMT01047.1 MBL fold metallo-hydrolase [Gordonia jinghuaiqii]